MINYFVRVQSNIFPWMKHVVGGGGRYERTNGKNTILLSVVLSPNSQPLQDEKSDHGMLESMGQNSYQRVYSIIFG